MNAAIGGFFHNRFYAWMNGKKMSKLSFFQIKVFSIRNVGSFLCLQISKHLRQKSYNCSQFYFEIVQWFPSLKTFKGVSINSEQLKEKVVPSIHPQNLI
jgi:hypothetical protein